MKKILIVFFFIYTSLFASNVSPYEGYTAFTASGGRFLHNDDIVSSDGHCDSTNCSELYNYCDGSGQPPSSNYYIVSNGQISLYDTHYDSTRSSGQRVCLEKHTIYTLLDSCPADTVFDPDTQHCVSPPPPTCTDKEYLDTSTNTCVPATSIDQLNPDGDYDHDGVPNKDDNDLDGDGIPNQFDDTLGTGTTNGTGSLEVLSCSDLEKDWQLKLNCFGTDKIFNFSCGTTQEGLTFITQKECIQKVDPCIAIKSDFAKNCSAPFKITGDCLSDGSLVTSNNLSCEIPEDSQSPCDIVFDNIKITCTPPSYIVGKCMDSYDTIIQNTVECITPDNDNNTSSDSGTSSTDDLKDNIDSLNHNLSANTDKIINHLQPIEDNTLNSSNSLKSIDSKLSTLISNSNNDIQKSINQKLGLSNNKLDSIVSNTALTANKLTTTNSKLSNIDDSINNMKDLTGSFSDGVNSVDINNINLDTKPLDDTSDIMDNLEDNLAYLTDDVTSIGSQYNDLRDLLNGDNTQIVIQNGGCTDKNIQKFASYIAPFSSIFALLTYVSFMFMIFRTIFQYLSRGEN